MIQDLDLLQGDPSRRLKSGMFRHPAWAVGSCSSGPLAARTVGTKSTGGCNRPELSPCTFEDDLLFCQVLDALLELQTTLVNANAETRSAVLRRKRELGGGDTEGKSSRVQGDNSDCVNPPVDIKTKVPF